MRIMDAWVMVAILLAGCTINTEAASAAGSTGRRQPKLQQQMDFAREIPATAEGYRLYNHMLQE